MALNIRRPEDFDVVVLGNKDTTWLRDDLKEQLEREEISYIDVDDQPDVAREILGDQDFNGPVAVVAAKGEEAGLTCAISAMGDSIIIHCADMILPLKEPAEEPAEEPEDAAEGADQDEA